MDVRQLRNFVAIVDSASVSKAAERLHIAQPSLSAQLRGLEDELQAQLLVRSAQGVTPTEAGKALYRHARVVLRQMEQIRQEVREGGGSEAGPVAVGFPTTIAAILAVPLFSRVRAQYPGIRLQIFESMSGYIGELLANGRLDLAMLFRDSETRGISVMPLFDEELYVLGGHRACPEIYEDAAQTTCTLARLANVPIVAPSGSNGLRLLIERSFAQANVELNIVADIDSLPTLIDIARSGDACSILPASALASRDPALRPPSRRLVSPELRRAASLCWSNALPVGSATVAVRRCIADLIRELQADGHWTGITLRPVEA
ncbi:LysR family transcriptional regulator [Pandoraea nosoerga]|uniref:LysR family transcriptional regulator n=1 Tax=Pandoraea nosoerga TaxID=2508296 RepID=A0A5E4SR08_9BURK|nr:LysR substrate-binding domain-containing protein [Pandoraea nosoerga]MBN4665240.1 LysR family transcriptional regulator [Pandoraea nosoerga]MBN4674641.1 LysR family transcriptional regulator [Pandoraea nosoerga]MBN4680529.1 LysR family transcriptional regulator [Pandoraea nosoerga]MBN4743935.1 LysR family transcriptional regulator [Pandoraea nosoerga]VVD76289.1 LysR family transcriptional regulator [Pandoraea nosoerga]